MQTSPVTQDELLIDEEWRKANYPVGTNFKFNGFTTEMLVAHQDGTPISSLYELENQLIDSKTDNQTDVEKAFDFGDDAYITDNSNKRLKIKSIKYTYDVQVSVQNGSVEGDKIAKAILKDVKSGDRLFFDNIGNVRNTTK
jgi:hypothetical protein